MGAALVTLTAAVTASGVPNYRTTSLISAPTGVVDPDTENVDFESASADGSRVFFRTSQTLTPDDLDTNHFDVYERTGGVTTMVSKPSTVADPNWGEADFEGASADGSRVFFTTSQKMTADDLDGDRQDVYERSGGLTTLVSAPTEVTDPDTNDVFFDGVSDDGTRVFFSTRQKLHDDDADANRQDVYERTAGTTTLVSDSTGLTDPDTHDILFEGASADGSRVFLSTSQKLTTDDLDTNRQDVYERAGGTTTLVSAPATGFSDPNTNGVDFAGASADGSRVFLETSQALTAGDIDTARLDVYERAGGVTTLVSQPSVPPDPNSGDASFGGASQDGTRIFFTTNQALTDDDLDTDRQDVYERSGATTTLVSKAATGVVDPNTNSVDFAGASADGSRVFLETQQALTAGDADTAREDVYERAAGATTLVSAPTGLTDPNTGHAFFEGASEDGTRVFFETSQKLHGDDLDTTQTDVYEHAEGVTALVSKATGVDDPDTDEVEFEGASANGSRVFLDTRQKLTANDVDTARGDIYMAADTATPVPGGTVATPPATSGGAAVAPTAGQIRAALSGDLKAAARLLKRLGIEKLRKSRQAKVKGVDALRAGTVRMTGHAGGSGKGSAAKRVSVLSGKRKFTKSGKGTLTFKLTKKGRRLLRGKRTLTITLRASFTPANGKKTSAKARKVTIKRK